MSPHQAEMAKRYVAVVLVGVAGIALASMKAIIISSYVTDYQLSTPLAGYLLSTEMIAASAGTIGSTLIAGRLALLVALAAILVGDAGTALTSTGTAPFGWQVLAGLGHGFAIGRLAGGVASVHDPQRLTGFYCLAYLLPSSLCGFYLPALKHALGPHALFLMLALAAVPAMLALRWFPSLKPDDPHAMKDGPRLALALTIGVSAVMLLWYVSIGGYWPYMGEIGAKAGLPFDARSRILGIGQLFGLAGVGASILIGDRFRSFLPLCICIALQLVAVALLIVGPITEASFSASAWLYVFGWLGGFPIIYGVLSKLDPGGRLNAVVMVMNNVAYALGPAGAGLLIRTAGSERAGISHLQIIGFGLLLVSGASILAFAARASSRPRPDSAAAPKTLSTAEGAVGPSG
ncbi:MAG: hypothetical protein WA840_03885 [Caulobacteraceae bacterium]